jgi:DNA-binding response OmpR family regulator
MEINIALLTENSELFEDSKNNSSFDNIRSFKSFESIKKEDYSVLLVDIDIFDTTDLVQFYLSKIRKKFYGIPVLLIIRVNNLNQMNLDWFFNDCILYPFRKGELDIRVKRLLWESGIDEDIISVGHIKINLKEYTVYLNNEKLELTYKEFELLRLLVENRGEVFTRKDLLNRIWGVEYIGGTRTVDVHVRRLRGKLGDEFNTIIETVRNVGYRCKE